MYINKKRSALLKARYREYCRRFKIYHAPDLSIRTIDGRGFIIAKNHLQELIDIRILGDGDIQVRYCNSYLQNLVNTRNQPFDFELV